MASACISIITLLIIGVSIGKGCHATANAGNPSPSNSIKENTYPQDKLDCGHGWIYSDELGCILFNTESSKMNLTWVQAQSECEMVDGFLVEIYGKKEQKFLSTEIEFLETLVGKHSYWIGATDFGKDGDWIWITSRNPVNYSSWNDGRPNDSLHNSDDCVLLDCSQEDSQCNWKDCDCNEASTNQYSNSFICQKYNETIQSTTERLITTTEVKTTTSHSECRQNSDCSSGACDTSSGHCYQFIEGHYCSSTFLESFDDLQTGLESCNENQNCHCITVREDQADYVTQSGTTAENPRSDYDSWVKT